MFILKSFTRFNFFVNRKANIGHSLHLASVFCVVFELVFYEIHIFRDHEKKS